MREVGDLRLIQRRRYQWAVECNSPFFQIISSIIYIAHETQNMQSLFTFFEWSNALPMSL